MKTLLWLIIIAVVVVGGWFIYSQMNTTPPPSDNGGVGSSSTIIPNVSDTTYVNSKLHFSIMHPVTAVDSGVDFTGYLPLTQTPLASFVLPNSMYTGTNLAEAGVYVGATTTPDAITACSAGGALPGETAVGTETINGADFYVFTASDAGAGNFYDSKIYRRLENGWCVEAVELLHSGNIGNYPEGTVTEFDKSYFQSILDRIVHTYESIPTGA